MSLHQSRSLILYFASLLLVLRAFPSLSYVLEVAVAATRRRATRCPASTCCRGCVDFADLTYGIGSAAQTVHELLLGQEVANVCQRPARSGPAVCASYLSSGSASDVHREAFSVLFAADAHPAALIVCACVSARTVSSANGARRASFRTQSCLVAGGLCVWLEGVDARCLSPLVSREIVGPVDADTALTNYPRELRAHKPPPALRVADAVLALGVACALRFHRFIGWRLGSFAADQLGVFPASEACRNAGSCSAGRYSTKRRERHEEQHEVLHRCPPAGASQTSQTQASGSRGSLRVRREVCIGRSGAVAGSLRVRREVCIGRSGSQAVRRTARVASPCSQSVVRLQYNKTRDGSVARPDPAFSRTNSMLRRSGLFFEKIGSALQI